MHSQNTFDTQYFKRLNSTSNIQYVIGKNIHKSVRNVKSIFRRFFSTLQKFGLTNA